MRAPDSPAGRRTELVMAALDKAGVLKPDEPFHPTHYNRAASAVLKALEADDEAQAKALAQSLTTEYTPPLAGGLPSWWPTATPNHTNRRPAR